MNHSKYSCKISQMFFDCATETRLGADRYISKFPLQKSGCVVQKVPCHSLIKMHSDPSKRRPQFLQASFFFCRGRQQAAGRESSCRVDLGRA